MTEDPLHLLVIEPRFPGRLGGVSDWFVRKRGYRVTTLCHSPAAPEFWPTAVGKGLEVIAYQVGGVARESAVPWSRNLERGLCHAYAACEVIEARRFRPVDVVIGHSAGLGSSLFATVALPRTPVVNFFDGYIRPHDGDLAPEDGPSLPAEYHHWRRSANAMDLLDLENRVAPWTATEYQRDTYPEEYRGDFTVMHDGIDLRRLRRPNASVASRTIAGKTLGEDDRLVTFVASDLSRLRGFDRFVPLANAVMRERTNVHFVAVGDPTVGRTLDVRDFGKNALEAALAESPLYDPGRFHALGVVTPEACAALLRMSDLHVVPSRPSAPARSMIEAMAAGAPILAWDSAAVREVIEADRHGLVVAVDDEDAQRAAALRLLDDPAAGRGLASAAVERVAERYDRDVTLPALGRMLGRLADPARG